MKLLLISLNPCQFAIGRRGPSKFAFVQIGKLVERIGIEPMTPCLQSRCSPS